jgi:hypothetical protein
VTTSNTVKQPGPPAGLAAAERLILKAVSLEKPIGGVIGKLYEYTVQRTP